jgi:hypothetical protein
MSETAAPYQTSARTLLEKLGKPFPKEAVKTRVGGGNSRFDYVAGFTVIHRLNDATGGQWSWHVKSFEFRPAGTDKYGKEQSLVVVTGELTIPGLGTRAGIGVQKVSENGGEDLVKGASTDALKKAATLFGVALELYGDDYEDEDRAPTRPAPRQQNSGSPSWRETINTPRPDQPRPTPAPTAPAAPSGGTRIAYNDPRHTTEYAPQQALRAEVAARQADTPPAPAPVTWTQLWPEAKKRGYQDRAALDALMAPEKIDENALWKVLARLREVGQPAAAPASYAG